MTIEHRDALAVIREYSAADGVLYVDPPYLAESRKGLRKRPAGDYTCEYSRPDQHLELAHELKSSPATVLLSGYDSELYTDVYRGWYRTERRVVRGTSNSRSSMNPHGIEVIWSNRPLSIASEDLVATEVPA